MDGGWDSALLRILLGAAIAAVFTACFRAAPPPSLPIARVAPGSSFVTVASWYGPGFDGKRTASGEIYDEEELTGASPDLPLGSRVMVTDLENGRSVQIRINDRGPYVDGRGIDLSHRAAAVIGLIGPGTGKVRVTVLRPGEFPAPASGYFVQVGSFSDADNAARLRSRLASFFPDAQIDEFSDGADRFYRVRMGAFATREQAHARAVAAARMGLPVIIVRR